MKSKQLNFFMVPNDRSAISNFLSVKKCVIFNVQENGEKPIPDLGSIEKDIYQIYLTGEEHKRDINILSTKMGKKYFDIFSSSLIQFTLERFDSKSETLHRARMYLISEYYDSEDNKVNKKQFALWASSIMKEFKKRFLVQRGSEKVIFYTQATLQWMEKTGSDINVAGTVIKGRSVGDVNE